MCTCDADRWQDIQENVSEGYEVGWMYTGHPTPEEERAALEEILARHGTDPMNWLMPPEIFVRHVGIEPTYSALTLSEGCIWAVYGILHEEPGVGSLHDGLPKVGEREYDVLPATS